MILIVLILKTSLSLSLYLSLSLTHSLTLSLSLSLSQGNISRQEAVSMIPPLVLNVLPHHKVHIHKKNLVPN